MHLFSCCVYLKSRACHERLGSRIHISNTFRTRYYLNGTHENNKPLESDFNILVKLSLVKS